MANILQLKRSTATIWTSVNPILGQGEPGWEIDAKKLKIGDGVTVWSSLPYYPIAGGVASNVYNEVPGGLQNGINTVFTTASAYVTFTTRIYLNGQRLKIGAAADYLETAPSQITFNYPIAPTDTLIIDYEF